MSGFDSTPIYSTYGPPRIPTRPDGQDDGHTEDDERLSGPDLDAESNTAAFKKFFGTFTSSRGSLTKYRDKLKDNFSLGLPYIEVDLADVGLFSIPLLERLIDHPNELIPFFEVAARDITQEVIFPRDGRELKQVQVRLISTANTIDFRELRSEHVSKLVRVSGIVLSTSAVRSKASTVTLMCRSCRSMLPNISIKPGLEGYALPRKCTSNQGQMAGDLKCPMDPYFILADKCKCEDFQIVKLQESPELVPSGDLPKHVTLYCDRSLCENVVPGNRVTITGIHSIKKAAQSQKKSAQSKVAVGVRFPYIRVVGIRQVLDGTGRSVHISYTPDELKAFDKLSKAPDCYEKISSSIAPSIFGATDIKKAIACLLFAGSRKRLPDGLTRRGDINVLLLGDPGTAKSQLLKFVEKVSPIAVYTSGKGSSAAGLTASVNRDPATRTFVVEGGAMVLADGGVVCIDEFDKMREDDRVAIHEAMEQQTISIAKAGITTTLNSRCSVLAAANSIFGRWDDTKGNENIDFMPTILSRFDMIFIIKDEHNEERDTTMAKHVMKVHTDAKDETAQDEQQEKSGELSLFFLKKYINYCRMNCGPRLSEAAALKLKNHYVLMRSGNREMEIESQKRNPIPITIRQLEAIVRIAEALAKMRLQPFAEEHHVDEAMRLFQVSTLDAANTGNLAGVEGFTSQMDHEMLSRLELQFKRRFAIGAQVSEHVIMKDFMRQKYSESAINKVIQTLIRRGDIQYRLQRKMLYRMK